MIYENLYIDILLNHVRYIKGIQELKYLEVVI